MKTALIGLGMVSSTYADALSKSDIELAGVFARSPESRAAYLEKYPGPTAYASLDELIADRPDFAILTTPPNARREIVAALAAAQIPILMEKPVERSLQAATSLCEICEAANVPLGIVLQHRARPSAQQMRDLIATGELGKLLTVEVSFPWWRPQSYYDEPGRGTYERDGGGVLISQAIHTLDLMLSLTGPVTDVTAMVATSGFHEMESEDFVSAGMRFANGALGTLFASTASYPGKSETITLNFETASVELASNSLSVHRQSGETETFGAAADTGAGADPMAFTSDWHRAMIEDFSQAVKDNRPPLVPARDALEVHRLIEAIEHSGKTQKSVSF